MAGYMNRKRWERLKEFLHSTEGPTAVEYAILLALIVLVSVGAIQTAGGMMAVCYENIADAVATVGF
jgi:pilus assembly protein Flp/PilA